MLIVENSLGGAFKLVAWASPFKFEKAMLKSSINT